MKGSYHIVHLAPPYLRTPMSNFVMARLNIQSTLVISNSLISNNRLSRRENLVPVLTQRSTNRQQNIVEKRRNCSLGAISPLFHNILNISLTGVELHIHSVKGGCSINCFPQFRKSDMSKYGYLDVFHRAPWSSR